MKKDDKNKEDIHKVDDITYDLYNYCDYRCDKCDFSPECPVYQEEARFELEGKPWAEVLEENLHKTASLLQTIMEDEAIVFPPDGDEFELEYQKIREEVDKKPSYQFAKDYMEETMAFLKSYSPAFLVLSRLDDAATDLGSYATILPVKVQRTLMSLCHFVIEEEDFHLADAYLTSQVVYKALHKSLEAVDHMRDVLEEDSRELDHLEALLLEIRNEYRREFPFEILILLLSSLHQWEKKKKDGSKKNAGKKKKLI